MTEGRFETIHNLRPKNWDGRRHWTNWHHLYDCEKDHLQRESCPFHDLRSGGQFQYEYWGTGEFTAPVLPTRLNDRPDGDRMDFAKGRGTQIGGLGDIPLDVEAGRPTKDTPRLGKTAVFTKKNPLRRGLFSEYPYMPDPLDEKAAVSGAKEDVKGAPKGVAGGMRAGRVDAFGQAPEWIADPYRDRIDRGRIHHLKAGPLNYRPDDRHPWMPEGEPERRKKRPEGAFYAGKACGIINDIEWIPDPLLEGGVKKHARPFRTWHTRTKWSMPTHAPWTTGKITAEPFRGPNLDLTQPGIPSLDTYKRVNMTQTIGKEAALSSMKAPERVKFRREAQTFFGVREKNICGYRQYMNKSNSSTTKDMKAAVFKGLPIRKETPPQFSLVDSKNVHTNLLPCIHQISRLNLWQEAIHFLQSSISESVLSPLQVKSIETRLTTNSSSSISIMCELSITTFLYYGHGESAFLLWRKSSTAFNFTPPPMLMMKLAVYAILVDEQAQEALDLVSIATIQSDCMKMSEKSLLECLGLWISFYVKYLNLKKSIIQQEGVFKLDDSTEEVFLKLLRLAWSPSTECAEELSVKGPQLALHAVLLLVSLEGGKEVLERIISLLTDDKCTANCLQQVANLLLHNFVESNPNELFPPNTLIFLLEHLFPLPLDCYLKDDKPVLSGLLVYQCFFNERNETWFDEKEKKKEDDVSLPSSTIRSTVGFVLLKRIQEYSLLRSFIYSIVSYDIIKTNSSLIINIMKIPLDSDSNKKISQIIGQQLLSIVEEGNKNNFQTEKHQLLTLGYISRILAPFLNYELQKYQDIQQVNGSCLLVNENFYIQLLISLVGVVHDSDVKAWQRLVERVTTTIVKKGEIKLQSFLSLSLRMQLHLRWWLPNLLTLTDTTREGFLFIKLKKTLYLESTKEWDSIACRMLWDIGEKESYSKERKNLNDTQSSSDLRKKEENFPLNCTTNELNMICNVPRLLVQRFVRWEWLLKGIWEFLHESNIDRHHTLWENLLKVCSSTLESCRLFHRNDIARDLMEILFFPTKAYLSSSTICNKNMNVNYERDDSSGRISGTSSSTLGLLLFSGVMDNSRFTNTTSFMESKCRFFDEIFRWLLAFQSWDRIQEMQYWPSHSSLHSSNQYFLSLQWYLEDLNKSTSKNKVLGSNEQKRLRDLFDWYESVSCTDVSLRIPQIILPLARSLRRAGLLDCLSTLIGNTFNDLHTKFNRPWRSSSSKQIEDGLIFLFAQYNVDVAHMKIHDNADVSAKLSHSAYENAQGMIADFAEVYILALWENNCFSEVKTMLLKPVSDNPNSKDTQASLSSSSSSEISLISYPEKAKEMLSLFNCESVAFLLPIAEREAMRLLLLLTLAQKCDEGSISVLFRQLPRFKADPSLVITNIERLLAQEPHLFTPFAVMAQKVVMGSIRLREACISISLQYRKKEEQENVKNLKNENEMQVRNMRDLNRCIDSCNWEAALRAIPHIVAEPLHVARKSLLACEKAPKGVAWEGAMSIFMNSKHTWEEHQCQNTKIKTSSSSSSFSCTVGIQELGRIMTLLANGKRWSEALEVFDSLTPSAVDKYIFSQTCFALRAGGHPELGVDLWAMWRSKVGDAVEPTTQMCGHFLRCGVAGDTIMADAACQMLKEGVTKMATLNEAKEEEKEKENRNKNVPGTLLPLSLEKEETSIITLLRDRWHESWQKALHLALVSGRPRIIQAVAWETPSNYYLYEAFMQDAERSGRRLSLEERSAIAGRHLDIKTALATEKSSDGASEDRAVRVLQEILGEEDDNENDNKGVNSGNNTN